MEEQRPRVLVRVKRLRQVFQVVEQAGLGGQFQPPERRVEGGAQQALGEVVVQQEVVETLAGRRLIFLQDIQQ